MDNNCNEHIFYFPLYFKRISHSFAQLVKNTHPKYFFLIIWNWKEFGVTRWNNCI